MKWLKYLLVHSGLFQLGSLRNFAGIFKFDRDFRICMAEYWSYFKALKALNATESEDECRQHN